MMWDWGSGGGWGMWIAGILMMVLFWGGIAALIVFLVRSFSGARGSSGDTAMEALRRGSRQAGSLQMNTNEFARRSRAEPGDRPHAVGPCSPGSHDGRQIGFGR